MTLAAPSVFEGLKIFDCDSHYSEPFDLWTSRAPARYRDMVPHVVTRDDGIPVWVLNDTVLGRAGGISFVDRQGDKHLFTDVDIMTGMPWEEIHEASYDPKARVRLLDEFGIWAQVAFPNILGFAAPTLVQELDRDFAYNCVAIYNDAMAAWGEAGGGRLLPQALLPFWDIENSVREAERVKAIGLTGVTMAGEPHLGHLPDLGQPQWEPLYEALSDLELPINIHVGARNVAESPSYQSAWPSLEPRALKPVLSVQTEIANSRFVSNLVLSDVLLKFPKLRWVSVESGIGWIPYVLERVDYEYREEYTDHPTPDRPTAFEMFRRSILACFWFESAGLERMLDLIGEDNVLWETDFPHPTCLYPNPVSRAAEIMKGLNASTVRKIMQDNAAGLYHVAVD